MDLDPSNARLEKVPLDEFFQNVQPHLQSLAGLHPVTFKAEQSLPGRSAWMHRLGMLEVLKILMDNAIRATQEGTNPRAPVRIRMHVAKFGGRDHVFIRVQDKGVGVPKEGAGKILKTRFTTKRNGDDHGLGLLTASQLVRSLHRGDILFRSTGKLTDFTVRLPLEKRVGPSR